MHHWDLVTFMCKRMLVEMSIGVCRGGGTHERRVRRGSGHSSSIPGVSCLSLYSRRHQVIAIGGREGGRKGGCTRAHGGGAAL